MHAEFCIINVCLSQHNIDFFFQGYHGTDKTLIVIFTGCNCFSFAQKQIAKKEMRYFEYKNQFFFLTEAHSLLSGSWMHFNFDISSAKVKTFQWNLLYKECILMMYTYAIVPSKVVKCLLPWKVLQHEEKVNYVYCKHNSLFPHRNIIRDIQTLIWQIKQVYNTCIPCMCLTNKQE